MIVIWQVEDGYAGPSAPQETHIDDDELAEYENDEKEEFIRRCIQEDFEMNISWYEVSRE